MLPTLAPTIKMTRSDAQKLMSVAKANLRGTPELTSFLIGEIGRAILVGANETDDLVTMNSHVEFYYDFTDQVRKIQLVYPTQVDIRKDKISVLTPIGAALIGLSKGQSIEWRTATGAKRSLTVLDINGGN